MHDANKSSPNLDFWSLTRGELLAWMLPSLLLPAVLFAMRTHASAAPEPVETVRYAQATERLTAGPGSPARLNLNTATVAELELLPGIGPGRARKIVEHRAAHGPFLTVDELKAVRGLGPATIQRITPLLEIRP